MRGVDGGNQGLRLRTRGLVLAGLLSGIMGACTPAAPEQLRLEDGWVRRPPPGMNMTAAYGRVVNRGGVPVVISAFASDRFGEVSLHATTLVDGISRMRPVDAIRLPPGGEQVLEPGGMHLMLASPTGDIARQETVVLVLVEDSGERHRFELPLRQR